ncbi:MAG TPA: penicillin-binding protein 2 [Sandaracinaceae bacterium LLY-WYZ-13_1]|nr:penicillin-binding protein 2 [Sandaracinaceae bacterium LLY-WYZ-13_1]
MNLLSVRREVGEFKKRYKWMALVVVVVFLVLFGRIVQLQLFEYEHYARVARENITRTVTLPATRGVVRDVNGRVVATNRAAYDLYLTPQYLAPGDIGRIAELMGLEEEGQATLRDRVAAVPTRRRAHQIRVSDDISRDQLAALETHEQDLCLTTGSRDNPTRLPCLHLVSEPVRTYPFGRLGAHAVGYLNEMTAEELERLEPVGYRLGDRIGRTGVERAWESYLRGRRGFRRVFVDVRGRQVETASGEDGPVRREPVPGRDLTLTLDMELMRIIERAFAGHPSGAAVVVDVRTGAVRALFSKPSYDLRDFTSGLSHEEYAELRDDPFRPLIDKTIYESYFPGSTFKPVSAVAALQDGVVDPTARVECTGSYTLGTTVFHCNNRNGHGEVDLRESLVESCNVYFYRLAEQVGLDRLSRMAGDFGLGRRTGIGINTEATGFMPTRAWYERVGRRFRLGYTLNTAIGQGDTKTTLVQLAMAYGAIANGGTLYVPQLVQRVTGPDGSVVEDFEPRVRRRVHVDPEHLALVIDGLYGAVNDPTGTAYDARVEDGVPVAGKTGTAQVPHRTRDIDDERARYFNFNRDHAWFAGFAPAEDPQYAIVVLVEHGGAGGRQAAPIAINVLQEYLGADTVTASVDVDRGARLARRGR